MPKAVRTYNPGRVVITINGFDVTGFADGSFITIALTADGVTSQVGADGEVARAINTDQRVDITLTLQQTSPANDFLSGIYTACLLYTSDAADERSSVDLGGR